ncbi:hypothetical protein ABWED_1956 [Acinetobacter lwoffii]|nr:hypothetical protein ABEDC_2048 [Acinetobacter lwoffii]UVB01228.1 hypothetical protein ABWED_1956 [Acinetobacter lwoffii]
MRDKKLTEPTLRICLWLISLFQPSTTQVQHFNQFINLRHFELKYLS